MEERALDIDRFMHCIVLLLTRPNREEKEKEKSEIFYITDEDIIKEGWTGQKHEINGVMMDYTGKSYSVKSFEHRLARSAIK